MNKINRKKIIPIITAKFAILNMISNQALAVTSTSNLPWEAPLETVKTSITGPVAITIAVLAMCITGAALAFGEELSGFVRRILMLVLAISILVSSSSIITTLFGVAGAVI